MSPDLSALRGLHLPTGGASVLHGEIVAAIVLGFATALIVGLVRILLARRQATVRRAALRELASAKNLDPQDRLTAQARLLRRLVLTLDGEEAASTRGAVWAERLDRTFSTDFFSRGAGRTLVDGLYRRPDPGDPSAIDAELARLFTRIKA